MAKTRSQTGNKTIKKEEEEDCKSTLRLNGVTRTTRNKITKGKGVKSNNRPLLAQKVKVEEDTDVKSLLKSASKHSKLTKRQRVSEEQIDQLIDAIVNDKVSVRKAAGRAKLSLKTAYYYYHVYKNDPEKKIPAPRNQCLQSKANYTQEQIENLIRYIKTDKMTVPKASAKANMPYGSGRKYYNKYLEDPNHAIPIPPSRQYYTQDQKNDFIGYIINDKMSIKAAAERANIIASAGYAYYYRHFNHQNHDMPTSSPPQEEKKKFISYITQGKMSIRAASKKANMDPEIGKAYYQQYLHNLHQGILKPSHIVNHRPCTLEQVNELIRCIFHDKMTITAASKKAKMSTTAALKYYHRYINDPNNKTPTHIRSFTFCTQEQVTNLIRYIVEDKMPVTAASKKANMGYYSGLKYYHRYLQDHH